MESAPESPKSAIAERDKLAASGPSFPPKSAPESPKS